MENTLLEPAVGTEGADLQYTYWQDGAFFVGFLNDYPDDSTQGLSLAELEDALAEVYEVLTDAVPTLGVNGTGVRPCSSTAAGSPPRRL